MSRNRFPEPTAEPMLLRHFSAPDLPMLRDAVGREALRAGLDPRRASDFVLAAHELAANSVVHAGGSGSLRLWTADGSLICEVRDEGVFDDAAAGRRRPALTGDGGAGLWIAREACDLVEIRSLPGHGTIVRILMRLG